MIPLQLSLEGIYSYQKRQTIDFTALTDAGLFGIFGAVASGKSTILEAITFALYGESDRMNAVNRAYNMMNLKSDRMYIEFDFLNSKNKKYRIVREFKRNSKNFDKVLPDSTVMYKWEADGWLPLDHSNVESIIGLSAANFKRTIIIPQGKFKEFIELGGKDRTSMMMEIFNLYRFDLSNNIRILYLSNEEKLNILQGKLSGYEEVSEEMIKDKSILYSEKSNLFNQQFAEHKSFCDAFETLKQMSLDFQNLQELRKKFEAVEATKNEIDECDQSLKMYIQIYQQFEEILRLKKQLFDKLIKEQDVLRRQEKELESKEINLSLVSQELEILKPSIDNINNLKEEIIDLELICHIFTNKDAIKRGEERTFKGREIVENLSKEQDSNQEIIITTDHDIETIKGELIDAKTLTSIELWYVNHKSLLTQIGEKQDKIEQLKHEKNTVEGSFGSLGYSKESWKKKIEEQIDTLNRELTNANQQQNQLEIKQQIAHFANEIHDGVACPLCGSFEHPHIIETEDVSAGILDNRSKLKVFEQQLKSLSTIQSELIRLQESHVRLNKTLEDLVVELKKLFQNKEQHLSLFDWNEFSPTDETTFTNKKTRNETMSNRKERLEKEQKINRTNHDIKVKKLAEAKQLLLDIEDQNKKYETLIQADTEKLKHLKLDDFELQYAASINAIIPEKKEYIQNLLKKHEYLLKQHNELQLTIAGQKATKEAIGKNITQLVNEQKGNNLIIESKLTDSSFETIEEIVILLSNKRDIEAERKRIEDFRINYERLKKSIEDLEEKLNGKSFSLEEFEIEKQKLADSEKTINELREQLATLKHDLERMEKSYAEKKDLLKQKEALENRKSNISTLTQMFKGSGFVNYVSSIYLQNLCVMANTRFHRLTKNQLSLQINQNNEFEIVDYLNDGRTRSVRTLSGGQNFQVSLSLALALAENVQSMTKSDKNFFFIDEGFGTQDADSVNIVFETLRNLQKENRIVGIISHVEELQERIPKSLFIRKDLELGSLIEVMG
ncbi:MAG: AAA family ATPase [Candidatus Saccharimonadaceae bacterium]